MANFENAKVGDKVYCLINGEGEIDEPIDFHNSFPISVSFGNDVFESYLLDGRLHDSTNKTPILYHSKPTIIEAKSMVKKEIQGFIGKSGHVGTTCLFAPSNDYVPCTITFEVEE